MISYDRLLVPVDGSDASHTASRHALALAAATGAAVDVLHVVQGGGTALAGVEHRSILEDRGRRLLGDVERLAAGVGGDVSTEIVEGTPYEAILAYARERGTYLVVMGRHGANTVGERLLGGVTEKVLRAGQLPVLTVWADDGPTVVEADAVLLPTDGSGPAEVAGEHAASLAAVADATVHVVSVADVPAAGAGPGELASNVEARCADAVDRLAGDVGSATGLAVETAVLSGHPAAALGDYVGNHGVDAVVLGAHGRSGLPRWLLGSVTERLLRTVDVPVLVVPAGR